MRSATEAVAYLRTVHALVRYLGISDGNMQEGSFRCDANVSVRPVGQEEFATRAELKNINSFRFVEKAINYEVERQIDLIEDGGQVVQETRLYDADKHETRSMRSKEEAHDYRYFPDPDLPAMVLEDSFIEEVRASMPELPRERKQRLVENYQLNAQNADQLTADRDLADYFEQVVTLSKAGPQTAGNWILGEFNAALNQEAKEVADAAVSSDQMATLLDRIQDKTISGKIAKEVFAAMWKGEGSVDDIIESKGLKQITDTGAIEAIVDAVLAASAEQVQQYKGGNQKVIGFFVGQIMKQSQGKANPQQVNEILRKKLD
jgi:aspartyl-tRNA(Asn)/glutamyl-tRNA(Gln) amidotransferase subunit B